MRIVIVGLGGIGTYLADTLCKYLEFSPNLRPISVILIDGDRFEDRNIERQTFSFIGNKAEVKMIELSDKYTHISFSSINEYLVSGDDKFEEDDIIFCCVDNHATRKVVDDMCKDFDNITLISGGNDYINGNVQIYVRRDGKELFTSLTEMHTEIRNPTDKNPGELGCDEEIETAPQLIFTNHTAGIIMCWLFYKLITQEQKLYESHKGEIYFDIDELALSAKLRIPKSMEFDTIDKSL